MLNGKIKSICVQPGLHTTTLANLGKAVSAGILKQVGIIETTYVNGLPRGKSVEAIVEVVGAKSDATRFYAIERHRGVAIVALVTDPEMYETFSAYIKEHGYVEGEGFKYTQQIDEGYEETGVEAKAPANVEALTGTEGCDA
ncbi:hypothetical protein LAh2_37 [Aeromonas phage LAh2]|uniref:Putative DNA exonuclease n=1 Tax=Aeromonas phage LAh1 TaxID=2591024 RepID=A0A513ZZ04_9CAUD|nr:putative DNA exonuclease [Aeromonas phage LAh1]QDH46305.1 hypothetical protein LAh2_37 [Aeromonas phage LAh2]QDH46350.1 putative DNA exonuclease [Aeromonas phage LAh3]QDH46400.1 putative DNA exonuclease [Aeromonas phage LAh4]QDH46453.1 putative DNA exonuclease [Aeromonas phage LAh5]